MLHWKEIDSVFLDMDGTLLDLHFDNHFWQEHVPMRFAEQHNISVEDARSRLVPKFREKEGTLDWYCVDYWSRELQLDIISLKQEINHLVAIHEHVTDFLLRLRETGKRIVLLTNAHSRAIELKMEITGIEHAFDALICSHDIGFPKEDSRFWNALPGHEAFDRHTTLFIDDSLSVLHAAQAYGIGHIIAIRKPDSRSPSREIDGFRSIDGFDEIMP